MLIYEKRHKIATHISCFIPRHVSLSGDTFTMACICNLVVKLYFVTYGVSERRDDVEEKKKKNFLF